MKLIIRNAIIIGLVLMAACSSPVKHPGPTDPKTEAFMKNELGSPNASETHLPTNSLQRNQTKTITPQSSLQPVMGLSYHKLMSGGISISCVCFDDRKFRLRVADQPDGCGSRWLDAKSAASTYNAVAAINGGFFTPEGKPLGLLIEDGIRRGSINPSSLGSAIFTSSSADHSIIRREDYPSSGLTPKPDHLLQSGPMLVEHGKPTNGLSSVKISTRSFIAWDGRHHWMIGHAEPCSLNTLAEALTHIPLQGFKVASALNLDGGRSSDLWVGAEVQNGDKTHRSFLNKAVRNYLVLISR